MLVWQRGPGASRGGDLEDLAGVERRHGDNDENVEHGRADDCADADVVPRTEGVGDRREQLRRRGACGQCGGERRPPASGSVAARRQQPGESVSSRNTSLVSFAATTVAPRHRPAAMKVAPATSGVRPSLSEIACGGEQGTDRGAAKERQGLMERKKKKRAVEGRGWRPIGSGEARVRAQ